MFFPFQNEVVVVKWFVTEKQKMIWRDIVKIKMFGTVGLFL